MIGAEASPSHDRQKLRHNAALMQIPIGKDIFNSLYPNASAGMEDKLEGVVDVVRQKAFYFEGNKGY